MKIEKFLNESPLFAAVVLYDRLVRKTAERLKPEGLGVLDALILVAIFMEKERDTTPGMLSKCFKMKASNLSHALRRLDDFGLLSRDAHAFDRRKVVLVPSPEGRRVVFRIIKFFDKDQDFLERLLGKARIKALQQIAAVVAD